ncbi:hypothetical protein [Brevibacillus choshinensis]|uniref:Uncharacterized protein n=1 Tax=Brevibacillus choshinensis TaxID=54911 RepID=A0ABX7FWC1_BRECH|nr:hypothetical protein [Brevibacillus choshinensis]QRG69954.1 hypothetical protein JNE38_12995 [Brevibacillus choshinensis]
MQLKKGTIGMSLVATLALLFGGWFLYQKIEIEEPIRTEIGQLQSASLAHLDVGKDRIEIDLKVTKPEAFPQEYRELLEMTSKLSEGKQVVISVDNQSADLKNIWTNGQFVFTEAMELHQYSRIPQLVGQWKKEHQLDAASALMDDNNIYVYLKKGTEDFYTIVPRTMEDEVTARG